MLLVLLIFDCADNSDLICDSNCLSSVVASQARSPRPVNMLIRAPPVPAVVLSMPLCSAVSEPCNHLGWINQRPCQRKIPGKTVVMAGIGSY
jgi:hypothetical protein